MSRCADAFSALTLQSPAVTIEPLPLPSSLDDFTLTLHAIRDVLVSQFAVPVHLLPNEQSSYASLYVQQRPTEQ